MSIFSSRDSFHKSVYGAVAEGTSLRLRLCLPSPCVREAWMMLRRDGGDYTRVPMSCVGMCWECEVTYTQRGLYFYHFEYKNHGSDFLFVLTRTFGGEAAESDRLPDWQQTVYDGSMRHPASFGRGIIYQIFPDRFFCSGRLKKGVPADRYIHRDIHEPVAFTQSPREDGRVLNNDYYGGDLRGITEKLDYIASLGTSVIYLNPIFEAHSNHRYNTADYMKIDPLLGTAEDFSELCRKAAERGIAVYIDGVFSHTGSDSVYFNREGRYALPGAYSDPASPYREWYDIDGKGEYSSWWGIKTLPEVREESSFLDFVCGDNGVLHRWLTAGASGVRLDVADELPDGFLDAVYARIKRENPENGVIAEVWEDASCKSSYGKRRRYLLGGQTDSIMNYPLKNAIISFVLGGEAEALRETEETLLENYPPEITRVLMNHIGSHDTERILTALGGEADTGRGRLWQSNTHMTTGERERAKKRLRIAAMLAYTLPGTPSLYYGDEAGLEGYADPFNRAPYPWGEEDAELIGYYRALGEMKINISALDGGEYSDVYSKCNLFSFVRSDVKGRLFVAVNRGEDPVTPVIPEDFSGAQILFGTAGEIPPVSSLVMYLPSDIGAAGEKSV